MLLLTARVRACASGPRTNQVDFVRLVVGYRNLHELSGRGFNASTPTLRAISLAQGGMWKLFEKVRGEVRTSQFGGPPRPWQ
jgi:hypothetical protein